MILLPYYDRLLFMHIKLHIYLYNRCIVCTIDNKNENFFLPILNRSIQLFRMIVVTVMG